MKLAAALAFDLAVLIAAPPLAALLAPLFGRRPARALAIPFAYALRHAAALLTCLRLDAADQPAHYAVMRGFVGGIARTALRAARVRVVIEGDETVLASAQPVVVLSVHAGEGDSLLVLHHLLNRYGRHPRIVMHEKLRMDPLIAILGDRLPNRFVDPRGGDTEVEIAAMSEGLRPHDAVLIFPEGGNFSAERRRRSIERLLRRGHRAEAARAERMRHVLAPRPGGALAAIDASGADVVFVAMAGFPDGVGETWRALARPVTVRVRLWNAPAGDIPAGQDARIHWLFDWWLRLDEWVGYNGRHEDQPGGFVSAAGVADRP